MSAVVAAAAPNKRNKAAKLNAQIAASVVTAALAFAAASATTRTR